MSISEQSTPVIQQLLAPVSVQNFKHPYLTSLGAIWFDNHDALRHDRRSPRGQAILELYKIPLNLLHELLAS